ncbi:MAG: TRAP transporter small permease subunit, partial [Planktotalea sp.]|uniref:TRAP transporter small permease subunit n=1 Tax=Planktotalea sp. TaxID=2029877 RepID=UPI003C760871
MDRQEQLNDPVQAYEDILEHPDRDTQRVAIGLDKLVKTVGHVVMWANVALVAAIVAQVTLRYLFNQNYPMLDEIQWHFYGLVTMIGISYALVTDSHVRVDLLHMQLSRRAQRVIEIIGITALLIPFIYLMIDQGYDYFYESLRVNERSSSPTGLPMRWAFKAIIPISFILLALAAAARLIHDVHALLANYEEERQGKGIRMILWALAAFALVTVALTFVVETTEEKLVIAMFLTFIALLFSGFPVAWTLAGVGVAYCGIAFLFDNGLMNWTGLEETLTGLDYLTLGAVVNRIYATMSNAVLVALPMFIFMGLMLDESGVAERLMTSMQKLFGTVRGGLAITVTMIGIILAASTGIIGASVVLLGVLSLPSMM